MAKHRAITKERLACGMLLGAAASGALVVTALSGAGAANATCASISGIGNGNGCTSTPTSFAVGVGSGATASATGLFNGSVAVGSNSDAETLGTANLAVALGNGAIAGAEGVPVLVGPTPGPRPGTGNIALAVGNDAISDALGTGNTAVAIGNVGPNPGFTVDTQHIAIPPTWSTTALADGAFNRAFVVGDGSTATAVGGDPANPLTSAGNNTALTLGAAANSYAGERPPFTGSNSPNNSFAFAGPGKNAINGINP